MTFSWSERQDIYQQLKTVRENSIFLNQSKATKQKTMLDCWKYCAWEETADHLSCQLLPLSCTGWIPQSLEAEEGILGVSILEHWAVSGQTGKQSRSLPRQSCNPEGWGHRVPLSVVSHSAGPKPCSRANQRQWQSGLWSAWRPLCVNSAKRKS